ncbi:MAG: glycosyltransferase [Chitinophagaceae bacterium]|nr:glycosyltransferase [Chitinophagaceae bacterium]
MHLKNDTYPLVSVAMCTYNGDVYLKDQLETIVKQTYPNLEIVLVDDCSTDNTVQVIQEMQANDSRIHFFQNEKNIGYNKNFEKVFSLCRGDFIAIADQDDIWEVNKIEYIMKAWPEGSLFIYSLSGNFSNNDFADRKPAPDVVYTNIDDVHKLVFNSPVHGHACMFKKELLPMCVPFPDTIYYDWWMSMHAAATGYIGCIPKTLTWHRAHNSNSSRQIMSVKNKMQRDEELRKQSISFIESFCNRNLLKEQQKTSLLKYASLLKELDGKTFSGAMFSYVFNNRKLIFHYKKKKLFVTLSYLKHAYWMGYSGLL